MDLSQLLCEYKVWIAASSSLAAHAHDVLFRFFSARLQIKCALLVRWKVARLRYEAQHRAGGGRRRSRFSSIVK